MKKAALLFLIALSVAWTSCTLAGKEDSSDVDQSKIEVSLALTCKEEGNEEIAVATFIVNEKGKRLTMLRLDDKSNVTINGKPMQGEKIPIVGGFNYSRKKIPFQEQNTFVYTDNDGKVYTNVLEVKTITSAQPVSDSLGGWIMPLSRGPLQGERVWVYMDGDKEFESSTFDLQTEDPDANGYYDEESGLVFFTPDMEKDFINSSVITLGVVGLIQDMKLQQVPAAGGTGSIRCETKEYKITIR